MNLTKKNKIKQSLQNIEKEGLGINKIPMECREFKPVEIRTSFSILEMKLKKVQSMNQETHGSLVLG